MQRADIDLKKTFKPVARHVTLRALLAKVAVEDLQVEQLYVKTTFRDELLWEVIYMKPLAG
jgi:hypothetical protein